MGEVGDAFLDASCIVRQLGHQFRDLGLQQRQQQQQHTHHDQQECDEQSDGGDRPRHPPFLQLVGERIKEVAERQPGDERQQNALENDQKYDERRGHAEPDLHLGAGADVAFHGCSSSMALDAPRVHRHR